MRLNVKLIQRIIIGTMIFLNSGVAYALTPTQRLEIERRPWYDETDLVCGTDTTAPGQSSAAASGKVYLIGDSISEGTKDQLQSALSGKGFSDIQINAKSSRRLSEGSSDLDGIGVFKNDKDKWKDANTVIIELGTNGTINDKNVATMMEQIKPENPSAKVFWVNIGVDNSKRSGSPINADALNQILSSNTTKGYSIIDWAAVVKQHPEYIDPNPATGLGVHPFTATGRPGFAKTIADGASSASSVPVTTANICCDSGVSPTGSSGPLTGADNAQKIFNFLISKGLTAVQAAGALGNMQAESHFEPRLVEYGWKNSRGEVSRAGKPSSLDDDMPPPQGRQGQPGYGIVQWTSLGRKDGLIRMAQQRNTKVSDLSTQLDWLWTELTTSYKNSVYNKLHTTTSLEEATYVWLEKYEVPGDIPGQRPVRLGMAQNILNQPWAKAGGTGVTTGGTGTDVTQSTPVCSTGSTAQGTGSSAVVAIAQQELATGANEANGGYKKYTDGNTEPWCGDFASWVLKQANIPFTGGSSGGWRIAGVGAVQAWFQNKGTFKPKGSDYIPKPGDIVIYNEGKNPYPSHVNIVIAVDGEKITTIGGNESNQIKKHDHASYKADYISGIGSVGN